MNNRTQWMFCGAMLALLPGGSLRAVENYTVEQLKFFETKIRPVLVKECFGCHSDRTGKVRGGLRLDTRQLLLVGGESGPAIVPGKPEDSLLLSAMQHKDLVMPPKRRLNTQTINDFRDWIEMGAPDPRKTAAAPVQATVTHEDIERARRGFWAYQPVKKTAPPHVERHEWPRTEIDRFVLAKLEEVGLEPANDDEPYRILRRLSFDLLGLPPTIERITEFKREWANDQEEAISKAVDAFLMQPQFGERWGRHWLDVARYAESTGHAVNLTYPHAWRYRDYVIDAFNADKPYSEFVEEQIAGDMLPAKDDKTWAEQLVATTFLAIGPRNINDMDSLQFRADLVDEQVDATSRVFLGMSLACARCHDHKFDAIPQTDYYAMAGFFQSTKAYFGSPVPSKNPMVQQDSGILRYPLDEPGPGQKTYNETELKELQSQLDSLRSQLGQGPSFASIQRRIRIGQLENELAGLDEAGRPISYCMGVQCKNNPGDAKLLKHGEVSQPGEVIPRGYPTVLSLVPAQITSKTSGRRQLAQWIAGDDNPLTSRVMANRICHYMLGQGIVASPDDFGATGQPPSHPELLDYLAARFVESNWSVKSLVREIAVSRVYRMRTDMNKAAYEFDPTNSLLWRTHPRRLDAESIRDNMLAVSGQLDLQRPHGSEIAVAGFVRIRNGILEELSTGVGGMASMSRRGMTGNATTRGPTGGRRIGPGGGFRAGGGMGSGMRGGVGKQATQVPAPNRLDMVDAKFRSVYLPHARNETPRCLEVFDVADSNAIVGRRGTSNTADQALYLLNNPFVIEQSRAFARRLRKTAGTQSEQIELAFLLAYGRPPHPSELHNAAAFLEETKSKGLELLCQSLMASAEFRYIY